MKYGNDEDSDKYGYDAGNIVDGTVVYDTDREEYVIQNSDGVAFSSQDFLKFNLGKDVRMTCISFEAIEIIEKMLGQKDVLS